MSEGQIPGGGAANPGGVQKYKIVVLGDQATGKTSLITRYLHDTFDDKYQATIGMDFQSKTVYLEDRTLRLQLWDTAGQERFRSLIPSYIRDAAAAVVVYDITKRASFAATSKWVEEVRNERGEDAVVALVGNKTDLSDRREVPTEEAEKAASDGKMLYLETSAKAGHNVAALFQQIAEALPTASGGAGKLAGGAAQAAPIRLDAQTAPQAAAKNGGCGC